MSKRFEDTAGLFGCDSGVSTGYELECELCGRVHNPGADPDENPASEGDSICNTEFAGLQVCDCCFHKIESAVLARMPDILPWFIRIIKSREKQTAKVRALIGQVAEALAKGNEK